MKLRIQENSVRLRLTRTEVARLHESGIVESSVQFSAGTTLGYSVSRTSEATAVSASFDGNSIRILLPDAVVNAWADSDKVAIEGLSSGVSVLIEKDFQCLHRTIEPDPEAYPHPLA
jgi:hypothetical protein